MNKQNKSIKLFKLPFGIEAISGQHITNEFRRHIHKTYIIGIIEQGKRVITSLNRSTQISEHEMFIINPGQVHSCSSKTISGHSYKILSVSLQKMQSIAYKISKNNNSPYFTQIHYVDEELSKEFIRLFNIIKQAESKTQINRDIDLFLTYLLTYFSNFSPLINVNKTKDSIKRVCDYINQNFQANLSLQKLARIACLSPYHFQREFKKHIGITPHEYLNDLRVSESKKILLESNDIADIALKLGFFDQSHFSRIFKKTVGIPPGKYSKINKT